MNGTMPAIILPVPKTAQVKPMAGIVGKMLIFLRHSIQVQMMTAIQLNHLPDSLFLSLYPIHRSVLFASSVSPLQPPFPEYLYPLGLSSAAIIGCSSGTA